MYFEINNSNQKEMYLNIEEQLEEANHNQTILVIDDSQINLEILSYTLKDAGYQVLIQKDGIAGIEEIKSNPPDLIILDVVMPKLDGFEICRLLQTELTTKDIPIIFITSLTEVNEKIKGLSIGAVDYITKPFQQEEVLARIKLHLKMRRLNLELDQQKQLLEKRVQERTAELSDTLEQLKKTQFQLIQSEKASSLGQIVTGIVHEVNNPIGLISTNLYYANNYIDEIIDLLKSYKLKFPQPGSDIEEKIEKMDLDHIIQDLPKLISSMKIGTDSIRGIMQSLQNFSRIDTEHKKTIDIHEGLEITLMILQHRFKPKLKRPAIQVIKDYGNLPKIECYPGQLNQVFMNLLVNSLDFLDELYFTHSHFCETINNPRIHLRTTINKQEVKIIITNKNIGLSDLMVKKQFEDFSIKSYENDNRLGLSISHQIITENHGGNLQCISSPEDGTGFVIVLPFASQFK